MKRILIFYTLFTITWIAFMILFNEDRMELSTVTRVISLYVWLGFTVVSFIIATVNLTKRINVKMSYSILLLVAVNVLFMLMDPSNIVTGFFG